MSSVMHHAAPPYEDEDDDFYSFNNQEADQYIPSSHSNFRQAPSNFRPPTSHVAHIPPRTGTSTNPWNMGSFVGNVSTGTGVTGDDSQRPMTSVNAVGYSSDHDKQTPFLSDTLYGGKGRAQPLAKRSENSAEDMALEMEKEIHSLLEEASSFSEAKDYMMALEKSKQAQRKEKNLTKFREEKNITEQNLDLTFATNFMVAKMYHSNQMYTESLDTYSAIVKNKLYNNLPIRLCVNMGNIYFEQKKYPLAIKMYRMALDPLLPTTNADLRNKILKNIGISFIKLGNYTEAVQNFESVTEISNSCAETAFNLLLCYYALDKKKEMRKAFRRLLNVQIPGVEFDQDLDDESYALMNDQLREYLKDKQKRHWDYIIKGAKLIAEVIEDDWEKGFDYIIEQLKTFALKREKCNLVGEMEMSKAINYLKHKKFQKAIECLKAFEKKDKDLQTRASTNLSFLYFLEDDIKNSQKYADISVAADKYNAKALVNKGNCYFVRKEYGTSKSLYIEALNAEPDCIEAMYNLGMVNKELKLYEEAAATFKKLYSFIPESIDVMYQIASVYAKMRDNGNALEWYNRLITRVPTDPAVLYNMGTLYAKDIDENQAYNCYLESYRYYPVIIDAISWLGLYFVKNDIFEKALLYFERASQIEPKNVNWPLLVASCHRRIGAYQQAKKCYEDIHAKYPDNLECLKYLVQICSELGLKKEKKIYSKKMMKVEERMLQQQQQQDVAESQDHHDHNQFESNQACDDHDTMEHELKKQDTSHHQQTKTQQTKVAASTSVEQDGLGQVDVDMDMLYQ